jgi:hypothetical protein
MRFVTGFAALVVVVAPSLSHLSLLDAQTHASFTIRPTQASPNLAVSANQVEAAGPCSTGRGAFASSAAWYINAETISNGKASYVKYGLPRDLTRDIDSLEKVGHVGEVFLYAVKGDPAPAEYVYVLIDAECHFQPYQTVSGQ